MINACILLCQLCIWLPARIWADDFADSAHAKLASMAWAGGDGRCAAGQPADRVERHEEHQMESRHSRPRQRVADRLGRSHLHSYRDQNRPHRRSRPKPTRPPRCRQCDWYRRIVASTSTYRVRLAQREQRPVEAERQRDGQRRGEGERRGRGGFGRGGWRLWPRSRFRHRAAQELPPIRRALPRPQDGRNNLATDRGRARAARRPSSNRFIRLGLADHRRQASVCLVRLARNLLLRPGRQPASGKKTWATCARDSASAKDRRPRCTATRSS